MSKIYDAFEAYQPELIHTYHYVSDLMTITRQVTDLPSISHFPRTPDAEWTDFRFFGLRSASAYLFVYDASDAAATFDVVRTLREQGTPTAAVEDALCSTHSLS